MIRADRSKIDIRTQPMTQLPSLPTYHAVEQFVLSTLCEAERLDPMSTPMFAMPLTRSGQVCGLLFEIQGPRRMRKQAVWTPEENRILFYDTDGKRYLETRLAMGPTVMDLRHHMGQIGRAA
jgi:hypothetical protein